MGVVFTFKTKLIRSNCKTNTKHEFNSPKNGSIKKSVLSLSGCSLSKSRYLSRLKIPANLTVWLWNSQIQAKFCFCSSSIYALYCSLQLEKFFGWSENILLHLCFFGRPGGRLLTYCCGQAAGPRRCRCPAVGAVAAPGKICLLHVRFGESFELVCVKNKNKTERKVMHAARTRRAGFRAETDENIIGHL